MKAIIPLAGAGTRLRPHTYTQPKPLIPVAGKPIISFIIEQLIQDAGVDDFIFVIGYLGEKIQLYIEEQYPLLKKTFIYQDERLGLGHALWTARSAFRDCNNLLIILGDTIFKTNLNALIQQEYSTIGVKKVEDPREFGVVELGEKKLIKKFVEKPKIPKSNIAIVGLYWIKQPNRLIAALEYLINNDIRPLGEYQLTDALMYMLEEGIPFQTMEMEHWLDCGKKDILLETNATLLKRKQQQQHNDSFKNSIIIEPVHIGKDVHIENSIIGPNVSIGDAAQVNFAILKNSIIGSYSRIEEVVLHNSVIGNDASIKGLNQSLNIGDNTEIDFS